MNLSADEYVSVLSDMSGRFSENQRDAQLAALWKKWYRAVVFGQEVSLSWQANDFVQFRTNNLHDERALRGPTDAKEFGLSLVALLRYKEASVYVQGTVSPETFSLWAAPVIEYFAATFDSQKAFEKSYCSIIVPLQSLLKASDHATARRLINRSRRGRPDIAIMVAYVHAKMHEARISDDKTLKSELFPLMQRLSMRQLGGAVGLQPKAIARQKKTDKTLPVSCVQFELHPGTQSLYGITLTFAGSEQHLTCDAVKEQGASDGKVHKVEAPTELHDVWCHPAPLLLALLLHRRCLFASLEANVPISTTADLFSAAAPSKLFVKSEEPLYVLRRVRGDKTDLQLEVGNLNKQLTEDAVKAGVTQGNLTQYRNEHSDEETRRLQLRLRNLSGIPTLEHLPSSKDCGKSQIEQFWQQLQTNLGDLQTLPAGVESTWNAAGHLLGSRVAVESWGADHGLSLTEEADEVKRHWETLSMHTDGCPEDEFTSITTEDAKARVKKQSEQAQVLRALKQHDKALSQYQARFAEVKAKWEAAMTAERARSLTLEEEAPSPMEDVPNPHSDCAEGDMGAVEWAAETLTRVYESLLQ